MTTHRLDIDGLRAIAILAVIAYHFDETLIPNGYLGVDIFFVISGYVITQSLTSRSHASLWSYTYDFYTRRVKRLAPALFVCVAATTLFVLLFISAESRLSNASLKTGLLSLFGLSNLYLIKNEMDYFGSSVELNPFTHTWSLGVEEQFYFLFPLLLWFTGIARGHPHALRRAYWSVGSLTVASVLSDLLLSTAAPTLSFYLMPTRFWELALGAFAYLVAPPTAAPAGRGDGSRSLATNLAFAGLIATLTLPIDEGHSFFLKSASVLCAALLIATRQTTPLATRLLASGPLVFIGLISYSLYLWHWPVLAIGRWTTGISAELLPYHLALIAALSVSSYFLIEKPLRHSTWRLFTWTKGTHAPPIVHAGIAALLWVALIALVAMPLHQRGGIYVGDTAPIAKRGTPSLLDPSTLHGATWRGERCVLASNDEVGKRISPEECTFGDFHSAARRFVVIGDSFSAAEVELTKVIAERRLGAVTITASWGASVLPEIDNHGVWNEANDYYWSVVIPGLIDQMKRGDVLFMINDGSPFSPGAGDDRAAARLATLRRGLSRLSAELSSKGINLLYQAGNPFIRESNCTPDTAMPQWWSRAGNTPCIYYSRTTSLTRREAYHDVLEALQRSHANFFVVDLFDTLCPDRTCGFFDREGTILYRDGTSHLSVEACRLARPTLLRAVDAILRRGLR